MMFTGAGDSNFGERPHSSFFFVRSRCHEMVVYARNKSGNTREKLERGWIHHQNSMQV